MFSTLTDFCTTLWTYFRVKGFLFKEGREVRRRYPAFIPYDRLFKDAYRHSNPFRISKVFLEQKGEKNVHAYGETPLPVFAAIAKECDLSPKDLLIELGCGRGRGCLFLSRFTGCRVIGIDWVPFFVQTGNTLVNQCDPPLPVAFKCESMETADLSQATMIYLYGTCLSEEAIEALVRRFETLSPVVKIVTVSYPLSDYSPRFQTQKKFTAQFPWGTGEVFLNYLDFV